MIRHTLGRPLKGGCEQRLLDRVLADVEVTLAANERAEDLRRQPAQEVLDWGSTVRRHISVPAVSMIGRTSTAQKRAAGSWVTISDARSMLSQSSR